MKEIFKRFQKLIHIRLIQSSELSNKIKIFLWCQISNQEALVNKSRSKRFPIFTYIDLYLVVKYMTATGLNKIQQKTKKCSFSSAVITDESENLTTRDFKGFYI